MKFLDLAHYAEAAVEIRMTGRVISGGDNSRHLRCATSGPFQPGRGGLLGRMFGQSKN